MHQETGQALGVLLFHGVQGVHGKLEAAGGELLNAEDHSGDNDRNHSKGCGEVEVLAALTQVLVIDQHGEGLEALAHEHRGAEVGKGLHEHHQAGG